MPERIFWKDKLRGNPVPWLLEPDTSQPAVRYVTLRDILNCDGNDPELKKAKTAVTMSGPVPAILAAQEPEGYWDKPGAGYGPKYRGTQWAIVFLAQLGAGH